MPGSDTDAYDEALRLVLGELPDLPHLPEVPGRGAAATMTGRALAVWPGWTPTCSRPGWRLTGGGGSPGRRPPPRAVAARPGPRRARGADPGLRRAAQDPGRWAVDAGRDGREAARGPGAGRPRRPPRAGAGAGRGTAHATSPTSAAGCPGPSCSCRSTSRRCPSVLAGQVPTASGLHRHRSVDPPQASALLEEVFAAVVEAGRMPLVHCCAADVPVGLLVGAGAQGSRWTSACSPRRRTTTSRRCWSRGAPRDARRRAVGRPGVRARPTSSSTEQVLRFLDMLGFDPAAVGGSLVVTPSCGLAGATTTYARAAVRQARAVASHLS